MAQTLADYLTAQHIRPSDLARDAGLKYSSTIANWMNGDVLAPYRPNVQAVAKALGIPTNELFDLIAESYYTKNPGKRPKGRADPPDASIAA